VETAQTFDRDRFVANTIQNILLGLEGKAPHDAWMADEAYCLCREDRDADGERVYTAYQLWIDPASRSIRNVRRIIRFLRFYSQKQGFRRFYVISSRLDSIKAYSRGLGKRFKLKSAIFAEEY
jgi:hypothetical protein